MADYIHNHTNGTFTFFIQGEAKTVTRDNPNFSPIIHLVAIEDNVVAAAGLLEVRSFVTKFSDGIVQISDKDEVLINGQEVSDYIVDKILELHAAGETFTSLGRFASLLQSNPNAEVREDLYKWIENSDMPLTEDGCFLAFKKVQDDFYSYYSGRNGKVYHGPGSFVTMPREDCDQSRYNTCSTGLHFCSYTYLSAYYGDAGKVVVVKINPKDVTAIPTDYNLAKGRCCAYKVMNEIDPSTVAFAFDGVQVYRDEDTYTDEDYAEYDAFDDYEYFDEYDDYL